MDSSAFVGDHGLILPWSLILGDHGPILGDRNRELRYLWNALKATARAAGLLPTRRQGEFEFNIIFPTGHVRSLESWTSRHRRRREHLETPIPTELSLIFDTMGAYLPGLANGPDWHVSETLDFYRTLLGTLANDVMSMATQGEHNDAMLTITSLICRGTEVIRQLELAQAASQASFAPFSGPGHRLD